MLFYSLLCLPCKFLDHFNFVNFINKYWIKLKKTLVCRNMYCKLKYVVIYLNPLYCCSKGFLRLVQQHFWNHMKIYICDSNCRRCNIDLNILFSWFYYVILSAIWFEFSKLLFLGSRMENLEDLKNYHQLCFKHFMKNVQIRSYFWSVFFCIWTEHGDLLRKSRIQSVYKKIQTRNNSIFGHFLRSGRHPYVERSPSPMKKNLLVNSCEIKIHLWHGWILP